jgi:hypothetical protein
MITINIFSSSDTAFAKTITQSLILNPYQIHKASPVNKVASIHMEISDAFFSFNSLINCGKSETPVNMLATIPIKVVLFKSSSLNFINKKNWQIQFNK